MAKINLRRVAKYDRDGDCLGCGGSFHIDPACDVCGTSAVNDLTLDDFTFDVFTLSSGGIGFTIYEKGEDRSNEDARCVDIFVSPSLNVNTG